MTIEMIACISSNGALGKNNELLFEIKDDLKKFQQLTKGHLVIMGRRTFDSIVKRNGKPLSSRINVLLTKNKKYEPKFGEFVFHGIESILRHHKTMNVENDKKIFIIGGHSLYKEFASYADTVYLTIVDKHIEEADTFFPLEELELNFVPVETSEEFYSDKYDAYYKFVRYTRS